MNQQNQHDTSIIALSTLIGHLGQCARRFDVSLLPKCTSTNTELLQRAESGAGSGTVVAADEQTEGRGRRGRTWLSAQGDSLTFSVLWKFKPGTAPAGLSLAVGLAVVDAVEASRVGTGDTLQSESSWGTVNDRSMQLKWPNDILLGNKKLGGVLIELLPGAPHAAVIGIGLNLRLPETLPDEVRANSAALNAPVEPAFLLAKILSELAQVLDKFAIGGFAAVRPQWMERHAFQDKLVELSSDFAEPQRGICRGVDNDGALRVEIEGRIQRFLSGEISLRTLT